MYIIRVEARMDILGNVIDRFNIEVPEYGTKKEAMQEAEQAAHRMYCQKYFMPVHFIAKSCSNWK